MFTRSVGKCSGEGEELICTSDSCHSSPLAELPACFRAVGFLQQHSENKAKSIYLSLRHDKASSELTRGEA